jgi:WD40 repeat protein
VAFSPDGRFVVSGSADRTARLFNVVGESRVWQLPVTNGIRVVALDSEARHVAAAGDDGTVEVMDLATGSAHTILTAEGPVVSLVFSPDRRLVAAGSYDGTVRVAEVATSRSISVLNVGAAISAIAFSRDGIYLAAGTEDNVCLFATKGGKAIWRSVTRNRTLALAFSRDGQQVLTGTRAGTGQLIDVRTGKEVVHLFEGAPVTALAFTANGGSVAVAREDGSLHVIEPVKGAEIWHKRQERAVTSLVSAPDGKSVAAGLDKLVRIMEMQTGREVARISLDGSILAMAYAPRDVLTTASLAASGTTQIRINQHLLRPADMIRDACARLGRNLNLEEWNQYVGPEVPFAKTCPALP